MSDQGSHFKNTVIELLRKQFGAQHHFVTAYCPWANGTVEDVNRIALRYIKALLSELKLAVKQWTEVLSTVQLALNQLPADRLGGVSPVTALTALPALTPVAALLHPESQKVVTVEWVRQQQQEHLARVQEELEDMHKQLTETSAKKWKQARHCRAERQGVVLPKLSVGDFVLVGQV
jgi:transposase InsO family protein